MKKKLPTRRKQAKPSAPMTQAQLIELDEQMEYGPNESEGEGWDDIQSALRQLRESETAKRKKSSHTSVKKRR